MSLRVGDPVTFSITLDDSAPDSIPEHAAVGLYKSPDAAPFGLTFNGPAFAFSKTGAIEQFVFNDNCGGIPHCYDDVSIESDNVGILVRGDVTMISTDALVTNAEVFEPFLTNPVRATFGMRPDLNSTAFASGHVTAAATSADSVFVTIQQPTAIPVTSVASPFLKLTGTGTSIIEIVSVSWTSDRGSSGSASGTSNWTAENIPLLAGTNVITVTATDSAGSTGSDVLTVTVNSFEYFLAEGATGPFFNLEVLLANPNAVAAPVKLTFLKPDGSKVEQSFDLPALSDRRVVVNDIPGLESTAVSTVVESTSALPLIVERSMLWDRASSYAGHGDAAITGPAQKWFFAEGSQGFFDTYLLLANANAVPAKVTVYFLMEVGGTFGFVFKEFTVGPTSRFSVYAGDYFELADKSFSISVDSDQPIIAERAMYFGTARLWDGGHESAGVRERSTSWFLAEGATGPFFDTYVLVANHNDAIANITFKYLLSSGQTVTKTRAVPALTRLTVNVEEESALLANTAVSTTVTSDIPIVVERAMYWPGVGGSWYEAHNSFGVTATGTKWGLSEGRVGNAVGNRFPFETYILLANPTTSTATVQITFLRASGGPVVKQFSVHPTSRFNVYVNEAVPELQNEVFGAVIESTNDVPIAVERAMYWNALGQSWMGGTNATGTRLP